MHKKYILNLCQRGEKRIEYLDVVYGYDRQIKHFFIQCKRGTISSRSGPVGHVGIIVFQMHQNYMIFASNAKQYSLN